MFALTITKKTHADEVILGSCAIWFSTITLLVSLIILTTNEYPCSKYKNKIKLLWVSASLLKSVHLLEWTRSKLTATLSKDSQSCLWLKIWVLKLLRDRLQISFLILGKFEWINLTSVPPEISSIVVEVIRTVLFFYERYFNYKPHKQNHLTNIQPNIYKKSHPNCPYKPLNNFSLNI